MYDYEIVVVGAGTAGLTAALYAARAGRSVLVLEKGLYGGQIVNSPEVENYPGIRGVSGADFAMALYTQAAEQGAVVDAGHVAEIQRLPDAFLVVTDRKTFRCGSVILAVGAENKKLGLPQEAELTGKGVSYCAACDGAFFKDRVVAVVGGGSTALEDANVLADYCKKVYLIHRRDTFRGEARLLARLQEKNNVALIRQAVVHKLIGAGRLEGLQLKRTTDDTLLDIEVQGLFVAIGQTPATAEVKGLVDLDGYGYIAAGEDCQTGIPGIFAAGDCRTKDVRQLSTAAADGTVAALAACAYIQKLA